MMHKQITREERDIERLVFYLERNGYTFVRRRGDDGLAPSYCGYPLNRIMAASPIPAMLDNEKAIAVLRDWDALVNRWRSQEIRGG